MYVNAQCFVIMSNKVILSDREMQGTLQVPVVYILEWEVRFPFGIEG